MSEYEFCSTEPSHTVRYLWRPVKRLLVQESTRLGAVADSPRLLDLGCGNGAFLRSIHSLGYCTVGVEPSESGVRFAHDAVPKVDVHIGSGYEDLALIYGVFDVVVSLEVVEHLYSPKLFVCRIKDLLKPGGLLIMSTPFHGYWKNLFLALSGRMDAHYTALWDHGHIKFWSKSTLSRLLVDQGFGDVRFEFAGRYFPMYKSMIAVARRVV